MDWTCRFCGRPTTLTQPNFDVIEKVINIAGERYDDKKRKALIITAITCPNTDCKKLSLHQELHHYIWNSGKGDWMIASKANETWILLPESSAKPQPSYIPKQIVNDYAEACRIRDLSPKASATLSRRCLQGMIRNFWGIKVPSKKLYDEITQLEDKVSASEWEAIDALRSMGNIGAHMKQDVGTIVDVESEEAGLLIEFIEGLFKDWYIAKHDRDERNKRLKILATSKGEKPRDSKPKAKEKSDEQ